ncbi:hypothetical protein ACHQM5_005616 [Ranunculus cassubicifolius]
MATIVIKLFYAVLFASLLGQGAYALCKLSDIQISQTPTGKKTATASEYLVTVKNNCGCTQRNIVLSCPRFSSFENIDPAILANYNREECVLLQNQPFKGYATVQFKYAYFEKESFSPKRSEIQC